MGRKIPAKKHRGVKDPLKQYAKRQAELETKINAPPNDADEQPIPRSLERVVKLKEAVKSGRITDRKTKKKKKKKKNVLIRIGGEYPKLLHPKSRPEKVVPLFQQQPGENAEHFLNRIDRQTQDYLKEVAFERKYNVQVNRNPKTGHIEGVSKVKNPKLDELKMKHGNIKKKAKDGDEPKKTKVDKRKEKLRLKKQKHLEEALDEFDNFRDRVKFGEVAHAPPQLKVRTKNANVVGAPKPGKKTLLLYSLLSDNVKLGGHSIDRTGKRKRLPIGERRQLENQQNEVITAYRNMKARQAADAEK